MTRPATIKENRSLRKSVRKNRIKSQKRFSFKWKDHPGLILFILALAIRLIFIATLINRPGFAIPIVDEVEYNRLAKLFASSLNFDPGPLFRPPLWPMVLGVIYIIFGPIFPLARLFNAIVGALAVVSTYRLALRLFDKKIAIISGIILSFYGVIVHFSTSGLATSLMLFLSLEALIVSLKAKDKNRLLWYIWAGALWGFASLCRPVALGPAFLVGIYLFMISPYETAKDGMRRFLGFVLGLFLIIAPITARNFIEGDLALITTNGGINLYLGNNEEATGFTASHPELGVWWTPQTMHSWMEREKGRAMYPSQVSSEYARKAFHYILFQPEKSMKLLLKKAYLTFNRLEIGNNGDLGFFIKNNPLLKLLTNIGFGVVMPFGLVGMILVWRRSTEIKITTLVALSYMMITILFFVAARFRIPAIPIFTIYAVYAGREIFQSKVLKVKQGSMMVALGVVAAGIFVNSNFLKMPEGDTAYGYFLKGQVLGREGKMDEALAAFEEAIAIFGRVPLANYYIGHIYLKKGDAEKAIEYCERELEINPNNLAYIDIGKAYRLLGDREKAESAFIEAYTLDPSNIEIKPLIAQEMGERAMAASDTGNWVEAKRLFIKAINLDRNNPFFPFALAGAEWALGDSVRANELIDKILTYYPDFKPAKEWKSGWRPLKEGDKVILQEPEKRDFVEESFK